MIHFTVDLHKIKTRELIAINKGDAELLAALMARFMVDDAGDPLDTGAALDVLLDTDVLEFEQAQQDFLAALALAQKNARA